MDDLDRAVFELMGEFGTIAKYVQTSTGEYDPSTGTTGEVEIEHTIEAILMDLTLSSNGLSLKYGTQIEAGDKELLVHPPRTQSGEAAFAPNPSDYVIVNGTRYRVITFKEVNPTGEAAILYSLYIRR
jgi:hypothetical protein